MKYMSNSINNVYCSLKYKIALQFLHKIIELTGKFTRKTWARISKSVQVERKVQNIFNISDSTTFEQKVENTYLSQTSTVQHHLHSSILKPWANGECFTVNHAKTCFRGKHVTEWPNGIQHLLDSYFQHGGIRDSTAQSKTMCYLR